MASFYLNKIWAIGRRPVTRLNKARGSRSRAVKTWCKRYMRVLSEGR